MKKFLATITLALVAMTAAAQVRVNASLDSTKILIGEQTHWNITVNAPKGARVAYPHFADTTNVPRGIEVLEQHIDTVRNGDAYTLTFKRTLTAWDARRYELPTVAIQVDGKNYTAGKLGLDVTEAKVDTADPPTECRIHPSCCANGCHTLVFACWHCFCQVSRMP